MKRPDGSLRFRVIPAETGMPLRLWVARRTPDIDKQDAVRLIHAGAVYINHLRVRLGSVRVAAGERITIYPEALHIEPLDPKNLNFVHREDDFVVIQKDPGVPVSPTRQCAFGCLSEALIQCLQNEGLKRPYVGVLHRLDQGASGLVLFTIRSGLNKSLHQHFVDHRIERDYRLLCWGHPPQAWSCNAALIEQQNANTLIAGVDQLGAEHGAKEARTDFETLRCEELDAPDSSSPRQSQSQSLSLVHARLHSGRKHQIRVHCAHEGHPIVGDLRYGESLLPPHSPRGDSEPAPSPLRLYLHAQRLAFEHPIRKEALEFTAQSPDWADPQCPVDKLQAIAVIQRP